MVRPFKTPDKKTVYAITGRHDSQDEIYKELAKFKKENFAKVKKNFKRLELGYIKRNGNLDELWLLEVGRPVPKRNYTPCIIAFKGESL